MYRYNEKMKSWEASASKRHPLTKMPISRLRKNLASEKEAKRVERALISELHRICSEKFSPNWPMFFEEYAHDLSNRDISNKTKDTYLKCLRAAIGDDWDHKHVNEITSADLTHLIKHKHSGWSESHRKSMRKFLNSAFEFALVKNYIFSNPTPTLQFKIGEKIEATLNQTQANRFLALAKQENHEFYAIWAMALMTGMRNGELYALKWKYVDLEKRLIHVAWTWCKEDGFKDYLKTRRDRLISINEELADFLRSMRQNKTPEDFVIPRLSKWDSGEQAKFLRQFLVKNKLPTMRFHDLRATNATLLLTKGVPIVTVMKLSGWQDLKTAQVYYRKAGVDIKGATDKLSFNLGVENA